MTEDPLSALVDLPDVREAIDGARSACEELRWHEAFRRRWREVRAEAGLRSARASASLDGARVPIDRLRAMAVEPELQETSAPDRADDVARGSLQVQALVETWMPDLGARSAPALPPFGQLLAALHSAATAGWLNSGAVGRLRVAEPPQDLHGLGAAPDGAEVAARLELLGRVLRDTHAPALVVAGVVHGELLTLRPFVAGNGVVARAMSRLYLTRGGLDPTGATVPDVRWSDAPHAYLAAAAQFATGTPDGAAAWLRECASAVVSGAGEGKAVADAVRAGRLP